MSQTNAELQGAMMRADTLIQLAHQIFGKVNSRPELYFPQLVTLNFLARGMTTMRAVRLLVENGLNGEAAATMRTLVELDIDLAYILLADRELRFERFVNFDHVVMYRLIENNPGAMPPDREKTIRENHAVVSAHYPKPNSGWCGISIKQRAKEAGRLKPYLTSYAFGSSASHSGVGSLKYAIGSTEDQVSIFTESREPHPALIELASLALFRLETSVANYLQVDLDADFERVASLLEAATTLAQGEGPPPAPRPS